MTTGRVVLLDTVNGHDAAALLVDGQLEELAIDPDGDTILPGAIYRAVAAKRKTPNALWRMPEIFPAASLS